jgi:alpha-1,2-mannosyltransferase
MIILLGPKLIFWIGGMFGGYLRKKTEGRKAQIFELVEKDELAWAKKAEQGRRDSDEWENVDSLAAGTARNGEEGEEEWDGIVGFFHPFWHVFRSIW